MRPTAVAVRSTLVALAAVVATAGAARAQDFEGKIVMNVKSPQGMQAMTVYTKGALTRTEVTTQMGSMAMINDADKKEAITVIDARQMYMKRSTDMPAMANPNAPARKPADIKRTGKMETIAGYKCEHVTVTEENGDVTDACMAKGLGNFAPMGGGGMGRGGRGGGGGGGGAGGPGGPPPGGNPTGWTRDMEKGFFPLKATKNGETVIEVTSIEKKSLDAALFAPPAGYTEMTGGMGGGRPPQL
jgi:hypothetical protein